MLPLSYNNTTTTIICYGVMHEWGGRPAQGAVCLCVCVCAHMWGGREVQEVLYGY